MKRELQDFEKAMLRNGNCYAFGTLFLEFYPEECKQQNIDIRKVQNEYRSFIEFDNGVFTVWTDKKYFFNTNLECIGSKE